MCARLPRLGRASYALRPGSCRCRVVGRGAPAGPQLVLLSALTLRGLLLPSGASWPGSDSGTALVFRLRFPSTASDRRAVCLLWAWGHSASVISEPRLRLGSAVGGEAVAHRSLSALPPASQRPSAMPRCPPSLVPERSAQAPLARLSEAKYHRLSVLWRLGSPSHCVLEAAAPPWALVLPHCSIPAVVPIGVSNAVRFHPLQAETLRGCFDVPRVHFQSSSA